MKLEDLCARRVAVWGLGQEGTDLVGLLRERGVEPLLADDDPATASSRLGTVGEGSVVAPGDLDWTSVDVVVRAPGVSRYRPELAAAEAAGTTVTTAMAVWLADFADASVLAVTGTKGKSTTAALAAAVLSAMGRRVELVGNIGVPVTETYGRRRADAYVVEISSYQATDVTTTPPVCVLTSLAPDHLDWHGGVEPYYRDKLRLLEAGPDGPSGSVAVNAGSEEAVRRTAAHPHRPALRTDGSRGRRPRWSRVRRRRRAGRGGHVAGAGPSQPLERVRCHLGGAASRGPRAARRCRGRRGEGFCRPPVPVPGGGPA